jgi:hypothetical protein
LGEKAAHAHLLCLVSEPSTTGAGSASTGAALGVSAWYTWTTEGNTHTSQRRDGDMITDSGASSLLPCSRANLLQFFVSQMRTSPLPLPTANAAPSGVNLSTETACEEHSSLRLYL